MRRLLTSLVLLLIAATSCSSPTDRPASSPAAGLRPADRVEASRTATSAVVVALGQPGKLDNGIVVTISGPAQFAGDANGRWLAVRGRVENHGTQDAQPPNIGIRCNGGVGKQGYPQAGSTLDLAKPLPSGTFRQGSLLLLLPGDTRAGEPVPVCKPPAFIEATPLITMNDGSTPTVRVPLADALVAKLNKR